LHRKPKKRSPLLFEKGLVTGTESQWVEVQRERER